MFSPCNILDLGLCYIETLIPCWGILTDHVIICYGLAWLHLARQFGPGLSMDNMNKFQASYIFVFCTFDKWF